MDSDFTRQLEDEWDPFFSDELSPFSEELLPNQVTITPGVYHDLPGNIYRQNPGYSASQIKAAVKRSVLHLKCGKPSPMAAATADFGSAVHASALEPEKDLVQEWPHEGRRGNAWKEAREAATADGRILLPTAEYDRHWNSVRALQKEPIIGSMLSDPNAQKENSLFASHPRTGLLLKARPDLYITERHLVMDIKTTSNAVPKDWTKNFFEFQYDLQAYHYTLVCRLLNIPCNNFVFAVVEKEQPYATHVFRVTDEVLQRAEKVVENCLDQLLMDWNNPAPSTNWPRFTDIVLPRWLKQKTE